MKLTKFTHACVRLEKDGRVLVLDPGNFSETDQALADADAVLITHEHADHVDADAVAAALQGSASLQLFALRRPFRSTTPCSTRTGSG
jgi:L-ascorbate metabolism protein UlaG (beta-lactamase superfamily)